MVLHSVHWICPFPVVDIPLIGTLSYPPETDNLRSTGNVPMCCLTFEGEYPRLLCVQAHSQESAQQP